MGLIKFYQMMLCYRSKLGYSTGIQIVSAHFGEGTGPIWLDDVECTAEDTSLVQCDHYGMGNSDCTHSEDVSVYCGKYAYPLSVCVAVRTIVPSRHARYRATLWILRGLAGWKLRLRLLRFFYVQLRSVRRAI